VSTPKPQPAIGQVWQERRYDERRIRIIFTHGSNDAVPERGITGVILDHPRSPRRVGENTSMSVRSLHAGWVLHQETESALERQVARRETLADAIFPHLQCPPAGKTLMDRARILADAVLAAMPTLDRTNPA
jgi:hypothetical protein